MLQMNKTVLNRTAVSDLNPIPVFDYVKIKIKPILSIKVGKPFSSLIDAYFQKIGIKSRLIKSRAELLFTEHRRNFLRKL
jgi:hypothetical protein